MATEVVTIESVDTKSGNTNGRAWTRYRVKLGDGRWLTTFQQGPGGAAQGAIGQQREVDITEKPKDGGGTELMLDAVRPVSDTSPQVAAPDAAATPTQSGAPGTGPGSGAATSDDARWERKDLFINRAVALKAAIDYHAGKNTPVAEVVRDAVAFEAYIYTALPHPARNGGGGGFTDPDDIPFAPEP